MKRFEQIVAAIGFSAVLGISATSQGMEISQPPKTLNTGAGTGAGDPSLGGTFMPPGGDKAGVDASERADKIAERKAKEAARRKEEERQRQAAADAAAAKKNDDIKRAVTSTALTRQSAQVAPPVARAASAPALTSTTAMNRRSALAPSTLSR